MPLEEAPFSRKQVTHGHPQHGHSAKLAGRRSIFGRCAQDELGGAIGIVRMPEHAESKQTYLFRDARLGTVSHPRNVTRQHCQRHCQVLNDG